MVKTARQLLDETHPYSILSFYVETLRSPPKTYLDYRWKGVHEIAAKFESTTPFNPSSSSVNSSCTVSSTSRIPPSNLPSTSLRSHCPPRQLSRGNSWQCLIVIKLIRSKPRTTCASLLIARIPSSLERPSLRSQISGVLFEKPEAAKNSWRLFSFSFPLRLSDDGIVASRLKRTPAKPSLAQRSKRRKRASYV